MRQWRERLAAAVAEHGTDRVTAFADGFVAYHIEVEVREGQGSDVAQRIKGWETAFRTQGTWPDFPQSMVNQLHALDGVTSVVCEGPQSSLLIPLRMLTGIAGTSCEISTVLGTGSVSQAIDTCLGQWGIVAAGVHRLEGADAPIEISIREPGGEHQSVRLYPVSRKAYRSRLKQPAVLPDKLLCNRFNQGIATLARAVAANGGVVSFRPRGLGRHDNIDDHISLLASTHQLILSSRHKVMKQFARKAGIKTGRGWPGSLADLVDSSGKALGQWLLGQMPQEAIVAFVRYPGNEAAFFCDGLDQVAVAPPYGYGPESRAARLQGALLGEVMVKEAVHRLCLDQSTWTAATHRILATAFQGTEARPWRY